MHPTLPSSLRIGVLRGGPSSEYDVSLKTGASVLGHLSATHRPLDIFISRDGTWHMQGRERDPERVLKHVDVVFNALHGQYGEDGKVQQILIHHGVPYTGSDKLSSAIAMNKSMTKERAIQAGVKTPLYTLVRAREDIYARVQEIFNTFVFPVVVKPVGGGPSLGIFVAQSVREISDILLDIFATGQDALVEEYIAGRGGSCSVIEDFRGQEVYVLPPVEVVSAHENKELCPSTFGSSQKQEIERVARLMHEVLGLRHYSHSDFIIHPRRGIYFLETNTLPALTPESSLSKSLEAVGVKMSDFIHHVLGLALQK